MALEIVAPIVLVGVVIAGVVYTQLIAPTRRRLAVVAVLRRRGWFPVRPDEEAGWPAVAALAVDHAAGRTRDVEYTATLGPFTQQVTRREQRSGSVRELFRDGSATIPRYGAMAVHEERTESHTVTRHDRHRYVGHEIWIGEARPLPVAAPIPVVRAFGALHGHVAAAMAHAHDRDRDDIAVIASPPDDRLAEQLRDTVAASRVAARVMADVHVSPDAWVLTAPLAKVATHVEGLLSLVDDLSTAIDRHRP